MDYSIVLILTCAAMMTSAWSIPFYPVQRSPLRVTRYAPVPSHHITPHHRVPIQEDTQWTRPKRDHDDYGDHDHRDHDHRDHDHGSSGVTGPVHTFVKTDKNANYKWGVRHHVGNKYAS